MNNDNDLHSIHQTADDDDRLLLENGIIPSELTPEERQELLNDFKADNNAADNNELSGVLPADEEDGTDPA